MKEDTEQSCENQGCLNLAVKKIQNNQGCLYLFVKKIQNNHVRTRDAYICLFVKKIQTPMRTSDTFVCKDDTDEDTDTDENQ